MEIMKRSFAGACRCAGSAVGIALLLGVWSSVMPAHPLYVSMCQIEYDSGARTVRITITVFSDDLENALYQQHQRRMLLATERESPDARALIYNYLHDRTEFTLNGLPLTLDSLSRRIDIHEARTKCVFEIPGIADFKEISVTSRIFLELYDSQQNLVRVSANGKKKNLLLDKDKTSGTIFF